VLLVAVLMFATGCGSAVSTTGGHTPTNRADQKALASVALLRHSTTIHLAQGRQRAAFTMRESGGVILLYRISAPIGTRIQGTTQLNPPFGSAPLRIATSRVGPSSRCHRTTARVTCTVSEAWCPLMAGDWHVHLRKLAGPPGNVTVWFHVGQPPTAQAD
jgi:hypothetical protein